jgi:hypothetical protein
MQASACKTTELRMQQRTVHDAPRCQQLPLALAFASPQRKRVRLWTLHSCPCLCWLVAHPCPTRQVMEAMCHPPPQLRALLLHGGAQGPAARVPGAVPLRCQHCDWLHSGDGQRLHDRCSRLSSSLAVTLDEELDANDAAPDAAACVMPHVSTRPLAIEFIIIPCLLTLRNTSLRARITSGLTRCLSNRIKSDVLLCVARSRPTVVHQ